MVLLLMFDSNTQFYTTISPKCLNAPKITTTHNAKLEIFSDTYIFLNNTSAYVLGLVSIVFTKQHEISF